MHPQPIACQVHLGNAGVIADEKQFGRRQKFLGQLTDRRTGVENVIIGFGVAVFIRERHEEPS